MAAVKFPPPPPLQFLQPGSSTVNWNWHDWFYKFQTKAADVATTPNTLVMPSQFSVSGNNTPTLTVSWVSQSANTVLASPDGTNGIPSFRKIAPRDYEWAMVKKSVDASETMTIPSGYQLTSHVAFIISGTSTLSGELWIEQTTSDGAGSLIFTSSDESGLLVLL